MNLIDKEVSYFTSNTYSTLNNHTSSTKNIWIVFHGIGYLSRYFVRLFDSLDPDKNYIIAPQAPSKFYKDNSFKKVGSCWLTRENTESEIENLLQYIDKIISNEAIYRHQAKIIVVGYSQGVSISSRWLAKRKIICDTFAIVAGGFPKELTYNDVAHLHVNNSKIRHLLGKNDPYFEAADVETEKERLKKILPSIEFSLHDGGHELNIKALKALV